MNKLALGTAQFGLNYGVANTTGKVSLQEARRILALAATSAVNTIDTAMAYGGSEQMLGALGVSDFQVVTKLRSPTAAHPNIKDWVCGELKDALGRLRLTSIYGLLVHNPTDLFGKNGEVLVTTLMELKDMGLVRKVGISVYEPQELRRAMKIMSIDLVQLPVNLIDRRFEREGLLKELRSQGIEIHARSAFLQGLLLMSYGNLPKMFRQWHALLKAWDLVKQNSSVPVSALCLSYPLSLSEIDRVVVGVDNLGQLQELLRVERDRAHNIDLSFLESHDPILINPSKWKIPKKS